MGRFRTIVRWCGFLALLARTTAAQSTGAGGLAHFAVTPLALHTLQPRTIEMLNRGHASERFQPRLIGPGRQGVSTESVPQSDAALEAARRSMVAGIRHRGPGVALMIVGTAGVITGLLINEGLVSVAGAVVGLYGLYLYVR